MGDYSNQIARRIILTLVVLLLTACASSDTPDTPPPIPETQEIAQQPTDTPIPPSVPPTNTPAPESTEVETQEPTSTSPPPPAESPTPTDTPSSPPTTETIRCDGVLTPAQSEGPYYTPNTPQRANLVEVGMGGTPLLVTGRVLNQNCEPVAGAMLDFWQAGDNGEYDNIGYRLRGHQFAGENGNYTLETIIPGHYSGRTPHIHVKVFAPDGQELLTSQIYIRGISDQIPDSIFRSDLLAQDLEPDATGRRHIGFDFIVNAPAASSAIAPTATSPPVEPTIEEFPVPPGSRPHDVAPALDGGVWYTAQGSGELGWLNPATGETRHIALGQGSAPHGVIVGPDGAPWITDSGLNAIVRVEPTTGEVQLFPLPEGSGYANLNTATFDKNGVLWFTGQNGVYGRLNPVEGQAQVFDAPRGRGPYGIATTPDGFVYYASLAGSHIARLDLPSGVAAILEPPTPGQGARRVWADSQGRIWVSEWNAGQVAMYNPATDSWQEWPLPSDNPLPYAVYVDEQDMVWLSDFGANALVRFNPQLETFEFFTLPSPQANVRQILGRPGEVWGAESGVDKLVVIRTR
jgi:virginiamycin B lyase